MPKFFRLLGNLYAAIRDGMVRSRYRLASLWLRTSDPWASITHPVPFRYFGNGSRRGFDWYLEGRSMVPVANVGDIERWLSECSYKRDQELFREADFWQHPSMFERVRQGDCEDHAMWAWRKLKDLGIPARFFAGHVQLPREGGGGAHAWVVFELDSRSWLFESVPSNSERMVRPLEEVSGAYTPHFSVDHALATAMYCGYFKTREERRAIPKPRAEPA